MKKFKDLTVNVSSDSLAVKELGSIKNKCKEGLFTYSEDIEKLYAPDDKMLHILAKVANVPEAVMLVYASSGSIKVLNVVPYNHSASSLSKDQYNRIIDTFDKDVVTPLFEKKYTIIRTKDNVDMKDQIPLSYSALNIFVHCPGWPSPFSHPLDRERWCDFICSLMDNGEYLSSGDLELWLREDIHADEGLINTIIGKYEDATELLEYYVRNYR